MLLPDIRTRGLAHLVMYEISHPVIIRRSVVIYIDANQLRHCQCF